MTQALNLANFANKLNTSGQTSNSGLQNSSITVTAGTGLSGGGTPALGGSVTINNAGVTSVAAGTGISVSASTGGVTISATGGGSVTSVATGNGLQGGTITTSGTLSIAAPGFNTVGSYCCIIANANCCPGYTFSSGGNYAAGTGNAQISGGYFQNTTATAVGGLLSGTWKYMGGTAFSYGQVLAIAVRVS